MYPLRPIGLFAVLVALTGCGSSATKPDPNNYKPTAEQLTASANNFKHNVQPNETVPDGKLPLKFLDTDGATVDLVSYRGKSNVVLVVVKGFPDNPNYPGQFCPGCLAQVHSLTTNYDEFKKRNAEILVVFPGPNDRLPQFLADGRVNGLDGNPKVPFKLLSDTDLKAVKALGIDDVQAKPSTYILDKKGDVVFAYVGPAGTTYDRPSVKALLDQLDKLNAKK